MKEISLPNSQVCAEAPLKAALHEHPHQLVLGGQWTKETAWPASLVSPPTASEPLARDENLTEQAIQELLPRSEDCNQNEIKLSTLNNK
ncbi:unnamed protein product [Prunus armeniaca]|uniref:Uncharacterized protein n=1 Tax=Prunus armeniaca TaxID=36596 RepID=A0A6J5VSW3_PRUAR|nr:unnamed protein product [Prunus armeniaca]